MSIITSQNLIPISQSPLSFIYFTNTSTTHFKNPSFSLKFPELLSPINPPHNFKSFHTHHCSLKAYQPPHTTTQQSNDLNTLNLDAFLSILEFLSLGFSVIVSIGFALNSSVLLGFQKPVFGLLGNRVFVWQCVVLVGGVVIGAVIRTRQWRRICVDFLRPRSLGSVNLVERIEKLEEDLRSSVTTVRVLSRQLEKLGIRFRVTRKSLKQPIAETAALAQKNSEATRALAVQEDILEKELGEMQKVLMAMQELQEKQLELILAIGKTGKLWEIRQEHARDRNTIETSNSAVGRIPEMETNQIQALAGQKEVNNDRALDFEA